MNRYMPASAILLAGLFCLIPALANESQSEFEAEDSPAVLEVTVYVSQSDGTRQPAKDVRVTLRNTQSLAFATTGKTGRATLRRPADDDLRVEVFRLSCPTVRREVAISDHDHVEILLPQTGTLEVIVLGESLGEVSPLPGATVTASELNSRMEFRSAASTDGIATVCVEADKKYRFRVEFPGFATIAHPGILIAAGKTERVAVQLHESNDRVWP